MKRKTFLIFSIGIWLMCVVSLLGIHAYFKNKPKGNGFILTGNAIFRALDNEEKTNVARYDTAIIRLSGDRYRFIGLGHEPEERGLLDDNEVSLRRIKFQIDDPILFERQSMVREAYQTLNNAEKRCLADHYATIIFRNGEYFLYFDKKSYSEYALKYGTECKQCDELNKDN